MECKKIVSIVMKKETIEKITGIHVSQQIGLLLALAISTSWKFLDELSNISEQDL